MNQEKYIKQIDQYLSNQMNSQERNDFEQMLKNSPDLTQLLTEFELTLSALNRNWVSNSWKRAIRKAAILKTAVIVLILGTLSLMGRWTYKAAYKSKRPEIESSEETPDTNSIPFGASQNDSTINPASQKENSNPHLNWRVYPTVYQMPTHLDKSLDTTPYRSESRNKQSSIILAKLEFQTLQQLQYNPLKKAETFHINGSKDTIIIGKKGIRLAIPAMSFVDPHGNKVMGEIVLKLTEYTEAYDLFDQGIGTNSNEGLLASGGSCYLMAFRNGEELDIKSEGLIAIEFPSPRDPIMTYFKGEVTDTGLLWSSTNPLPEYTRISNSKSIERGPLNVIRNEEEGIFSDAPTGDRSQMFCFNMQATQGDKKDALIQKMIEDSVNYKTVYAYFNSLKTANRDWAYSLFKRKEKTLEGDTPLIHYRINANGKLYKYTTSGTTKKKDTRKLRKLAKSQGQILLDSNWEHGEYAFTLMLFPAVNYSNFSKNRIKTDSMLKDEFELKQVINNRIYANQLGYINCDRFTNRAKSKISTFRSSDSSGVLYIHIPRINGLLRQGPNTMVELLPKETINVIYISYESTGLKMSILEDVKADPIIWVDRSFSPFDKERIKRVLK